MGLEVLDSVKKITPVVRSDGKRRVTDHTDDSIGGQLARAETPSAVGRLLVKAGVPEADVIALGKGAPNWGQFRMTVGNRLRGIESRMAKGMTRAEAVSGKRPPKAASSGPRNAKVAKKTAKKVAKVAKKVGKKVAKKAASKPASADGDGERSHHLDSAMTAREAADFARAFASTMEMVEEQDDEGVALVLAKKSGMKDHLVVKGEGKDAGRFLIMKMVLKKMPGVKKFGTGSPA